MLIDKDSCKTNKLEASKDIFCSAIINRKPNAEFNLKLIKIAVFAFIIVLYCFF